MLYFTLKKSILLVLFYVLVQLLKDMVKKFSQLFLKIWDLVLSGNMLGQHRLRSNEPSDIMFSTLILRQGMPGTKNPDALLLVPQFPPPIPVIRALLDCGYYFGSIAPMGNADLWWMKNIQEGKEIHCQLCHGQLNTGHFLCYCLLSHVCVGLVLSEWIFDLFVLGFWLKITQPPHSN